MKLLLGAKMMKPQETPQAGTREKAVFRSHTKKSVNMLRFLTVV